MDIKILLPFQVFARVEDVLRIVVETSVGSMGLLPQRLDCVAALVPGILSYEATLGGMQYVAIDQGVLVKAGAQVLISVRRAIRGRDLGQLREAIKRDFLIINAQEKEMHDAMMRIESGLTRRLAQLERA